MKGLVFFLLPLCVFAGTVGKISGRVVDAKTNEPLCAVDVYIPVLGIGGASDIDGNYFILNVPAGIYDVEASMIGYQSEIKKNVQVFADRTVFLDFKLNSTTIEINPVVVVAKKPIIEIDMTSKESRITQNELALIPIEKTTEAIALKGGVTTDAGGNLHIRGGRDDELIYYIDGVKVTNALTGTTPVLPRNIVYEMSLLSGTFNAEYGNVMSGVVNVVTPEGGPTLSSYIEYTTWSLNPSPYHKPDWIDFASDAHRDSLGNSLYRKQNIQKIKNLPFLGEIIMTLNGPMPFDKNTHFFFAGDYSNQESYLPFGYELIRSVNGKLSRRITTNFKLFVESQYLTGETQNYNHLYKYLYENYLVNNTTNIRFIGGVNHTLSNYFFYNLRLGYLADETKTEVPGLASDSIIEPVYDNYSEFYISGYPIFRQNVRTKEYIIKDDFNLQAGKIHGLKWGSEISFYEFSLKKREQLFARGPIVYQDYIKKPMAGAFFIQDKIEHKYLVVNAGLRLDYYNPNAFMWQDIENPESDTETVVWQYQPSPRLGLSHPITDNAMFHFAYGHFFQVPAFEVMYFNNSYVLHPESIPRYGLVGNPKILPQRTTSYEVGIKNAFGGIYGLDITLFLKDIKNLLSTTEVRTFPYDYIIYTNEDFGSVQGIDLTLNREITDGLGFDINYTYQIARGNRSFAMQGFYDVYTGMPERMKEYYLDFDRRHTMTGNLYITPWPMANIGVNVHLASGLPYTPYVSEGIVVEQNSARMGWEFSLDLMAQQGIKFTRANIILFLKATNITDHLNPKYVYARTGKPWDSGEESGGLMGSKDYIMDPANVGKRRTIKAGIKVTI